jgi:hypothetical protein
MKWSGRTTLHAHKFDNNWKDHVVNDMNKKGVRKVNLLDVQWSTCPIEVEKQVKELWIAHRLGNDNSIIETSIHELETEEETKTDAIVQYLKEQGIKENEEVIIYWWW